MLLATGLVSGRLQASATDYCAAAMLLMPALLSRFTALTLLWAAQSGSFRLQDVTQTHVEQSASFRMAR